MRSFTQMQVGFAPRLAGLYVGIFIMGGIQMPFFPVWLKAKGLDPGMIGVVLAAPIVVRIFAISLAARAADRRDAIRATIIAASWLTVAGFVLVGQAEGAGAILITYVLASLALTPVLPLAETYALKGLSARGRAYGPVRLWGSAAFILGTFVAGFASDTIPARHLIWLIVAASLISALVSLALEPLSTAAPPASAPPGPRKHLLLDPAFIAVLAGASLIQASHAVYYSFSALEWRGAGLDGTAIAALWALGVIAEIVLFAFSGRLPPFFQPVTLLLIGAAGATLRWAAMALDAAGCRAAVPATAARAVVRRHPSRRARLCRAPCAGRAGRDRARLSVDRAGRGDGGRDRTVGMALRRFRQPRLRGDGANGGCWRRLRVCSAASAPNSAALSAAARAASGARSSPRRR